MTHHPPRSTPSASEISNLQASLALQIASPSLILAPSSFEQALQSYSSLHSIYQHPLSTSQSHYLVL